jgi:hypothetical protein
MPAVPELAFVLAPQQNHFFVELVAALRHELEQVGMPASVHVGAFPPPRPGVVYALVPPHEYFTLMHGRVGPPPDVLARTLYVCAEQPATSFFDDNLRLAPHAGAVFDVNALAVRELERHGIRAEHLPLGWTATWDRWAERDQERDIDVLFMGCASDRRLELLAGYAPQLRHRRCHYVISDNSRPNWEPSASFITDEDKWDLLGRSKVLLNVHQGEAPYFEWLRVAQAMANGAAVVSEHSLDVAPLQPGTHFLSGRPENLGLLTEGLLLDDARRHHLTTTAYRDLRERLPLRSSAERLTAAVERLDERPVPVGDSAFFMQPPPDCESRARLDRLGRPASSGSLAVELAPLWRAVKDIERETAELRRGLSRLTLEREEGRSTAVVMELRSRGHLSMAPRVSVLVSVFDGEDVIREALDSVARSHERAWELIVVDDGSQDGSMVTARRWIAAHDDAAAMLLRHPVNRGVGYARNTALAFARAPFCFVLDADDAVYPEGFDRLLAALEADPDAAFAYGMHERVVGDRSAGLLNYLPWSPERLRLGDSIDGTAMIRTEALRALGGYRTDRRLHGSEDYDLWCRVAEAGGHGAFVPDVVARRRATDHPMIASSAIQATPLAAAPT